MNDSNSAEDEDSFDDDIDIDEFEDIDNTDGGVSVVDTYDARRRLEEILEAKALERLINGDFYDD